MSESKKEGRVTKRKGRTDRGRIVHWLRKIGSDTNMRYSARGLRAMEDVLDALGRKMQRTLGELQMMKKMKLVSRDGGKRRETQKTQTLQDVMMGQAALLVLGPVFGPEASLYARHKIAVYRRAVVAAAASD